MLVLENHRVKTHGRSENRRSLTEMDSVLQKHLERLLDLKVINFGIRQNFDKLEIPENGPKAKSKGTLADQVNKAQMRKAPKYSTKSTKPRSSLLSSRIMRDHMKPKTSPFPVKFRAKEHSI